MKKKQTKKNNQLSIRAKQNAGPLATIIAMYHEGEWLTYLVGLSTLNQTSPMHSERHRGGNGPWIRKLVFEIVINKLFLYDVVYCLFLRAQCSNWGEAFQSRRARQSHEIL